MIVDDELVVELAAIHQLKTLKTSLESGLWHTLSGSFRTWRESTTLMLLRERLTVLHAHVAEVTSRLVNAKMQLATNAFECAEQKRN